MVLPFLHCRTVRFDRHFSSNVIKTNKHFSVKPNRKFKISWEPACIGFRSETYLSCLLLKLCFIAKPKSSPTWQCPHLLQRKRTVLWLLSSWDLSSAFADRVKVTPCFFSSQVMFSKKHDMFRIPGSGGHLIWSLDPRKHKCAPKLPEMRYQNLPELTKTKRDLLNSCSTSEHLVESQSTGETFLLKVYKKTAKIIVGSAKMKTEALMVFKLDEEGNAIYTNNIGDLAIFLSKAEPFCVPASSFPGMISDRVYILDDNEYAYVDMTDSSITSFMARHHKQKPYIHV